MSAFVDQARHEVEPFVPDPIALEIWSREFFRDIAAKASRVLKPLCVENWLGARTVCRRDRVARRLAFLFASGT